MNLPMGMVTKVGGLSPLSFTQALGLPSQSRYLKVTLWSVVALVSTECHQKAICPLHLGLLTVTCVVPALCRS
jgi:hypothetical protein